MRLIDVVCPNCGEYLEGDGFKRVLHCPNAEAMKVDFSEPDGDIILCVDLGVSDMYGFENYTFDELRDRYSTLSKKINELEEELYLLNEESDTILEEYAKRGGLI